MRRPVSILFTIPNFITAGSGQAMLNIVQRLDRRRFAPAVCVSRKGGRLDRVVEEMGIPFLEAPFTVPAQPYPGLLLRAWRASRLFRPHRFALWHSFHYSDDITEPLIARLSGARGWVYTKKNMNWGRRTWYVRTYLAQRVAVQNSDMMRDFFGRPSFRQKARSVPRGVDTERFRPVEADGACLRQELGIPPDAAVVGCVAHLVPVKGHPTLIQALASVDGAWLVVAGKPLDPDYTALLERMAREAGAAERVRFIGDVNEVPALLAQLDVVVLPTWAKWRMEGCPVALLEAMSCAKACVATDIPGSRDLIEHGRSGLLVPPEDPEALAAALRQLVASPELRRSLGENARARVLQHFTIEQEVTAHEALYSEILGLDR